MSEMNAKKSEEYNNSSAIDEEVTGNGESSGTENGNDTVGDASSTASPIQDLSASNVESNYSPVTDISNLHTVMTHKKTTPIGRFFNFLKIGKPDSKKQSAPKIEETDSSEYQQEVALNQDISQDSSEGPVDTSLPLNSNEEQIRLFIQEEVLRLQSDEQERKQEQVQKKIDNQIDILIEAIQQTDFKTTLIRSKVAMGHIEWLREQAKRNRDNEDIPLLQRIEISDNIRSQFDVVHQEVSAIKSNLKERFAIALPRGNNFSRDKNLQHELQAQKTDLAQLKQQIQRTRVWQITSLVFFLVLIAATLIFTRILPQQDLAVQANVRSLIETASLYQTGGQTDDAERILDEAVKLGITDTNLMGRAGQIYYTIGANKKASDILELAVKQSPENQLFRLNLARSYARQNKDQNAVEQYIALIDLNPTNFVYHLELGNRYESQQKYDLAETQYTEVTRINPDRFEGYYNLGQLYRLKIMNYEKAAQQYKMALEKRPDNYLSQVYYADSLAKLGLFDEAITNLQNSIELNPEGQTAPLFMGDIYFNRQSYEEALSWYQKVLEINPNLVGALVGAGKSLVQLDDCATATTYFVDTLRIQPTNQDAQSGLNQCTGK